MFVVLPVRTAMCALCNLSGAASTADIALLK
jgi:hypothetical protein